MCSPDMMNTARVAIIKSALGAPTTTFLAASPALSNSYCNSGRTIHNANRPTGTDVRKTSRQLKNCRNTPNTAIPSSVPTLAAMMGMEYARPRSLSPKTIARMGFALELIIDAPSPTNPLQITAWVTLTEVTANKEARAISMMPTK